VIVLELVTLIARWIELSWIAYRNKDQCN